VLAIVSEQSHGQAYVFRMPGGCFAATPAHVVEAADGTLASPMLRARDGREGQGTQPLRPDPKFDLVFVNVTGRLASPCGSAENLGYDRLDHRLQSEKSVTLRVARTRSGIQQIPLRLSKFNQTYLFLASESAQEVDTLMQSMSGGLVADVEGTPLGVLLSVSDDDGLAQALRFDVVKRLALQSLAIREESRASAAGARLRLLEWKGETVDANHPPASVLQGGFWRAKPDARQTALVFAIASGNKISRISVARPPVPAEEPDLLTVRTAQAPDDEPILMRTCTKVAAPAPTLFDCSIAPTAAGVVRLEFGQRTGSILTIGPVEVH
jgi:hypothetical protein